MTVAKRLVDIDEHFSAISTEVHLYLCIKERFWRSDIKYEEEIEILISDMLPLKSVLCFFLTLLNQELKKNKNIKCFFRAFLSVHNNFLKLTLIKIA